MKNKNLVGIDKPCEFSLPNGNLLIIGTGAIGVSFLPGWCTAIKEWYSFNIKVLLSRSAENMVSKQALKVTSGNSVLTSDFNGNSEFMVPHKELAEWADLVIVAPATLNFIAKTSLLISDSLEVYTSLLTKAPVLIAPSIPEYMWKSHQAQLYVSNLRTRGWKVLEPSLGIAVSDSKQSQSALPNIYDVLLEASDLLKENN